MDIYLQASPSEVGAGVVAVIDELGLPGSKGDDGLFDGGDTAAILGNVLALQRSDFPVLHLRLLHLITSAEGLPRRHPDKSKWYGQTDRFSRDQLIPIICAGIRVPHICVDEIFTAHRKRWFVTAWNTKKNGVMDTPDKFPDITGPEVWALWLRYKRPSWAWLVIWLLDIETLIGSITWRWFTPTTNRVCRNHMLVCLTGIRSYPSITMRIAYALNDWKDLTFRWRGHCLTMREFDTYTLFEEALN